MSYAPHVATFGSEREAMHRAPERLVVCVNTTRAWRHKHGGVSAPQLERAARTLAGAAAAQLRVVVVHQPAAVTMAEDRRHRLRGHAAALPHRTAAGADLAMGGHVHLHFVLALPGLARPMWVVQAGTAVLSRVRQGVPISVNLLRWGAHAAPGQCRGEPWDCTAADLAFVPAAARYLRLAGS